jgi:hypothetical protein
MKIEIVHRDYVHVPFTSRNVIDGLCKPTWILETESFLYKANSLNDVLWLWRNTTGDGLVLNVGTIG